MNEFITEHGSMLLGCIISLFCIPVMFLVIRTCADLNMTVFDTVFGRSVSQSNQSLLEVSAGQYPVIVADEVLYADYKDGQFDYKDFVTATDCTGKDITDKIRYYGTVDVFQKGIYRLRCVVVADNHLTCTKYIYVAVE